MRLRANVFFLLVLFALAAAGRLGAGLLAFAVVLLHELGHIVAARLHGIAVREVELLPFGGVARLERLIETSPSVEAGIALAGPLTNGLLIGFAALCWHYGIVSPGWARLFIELNAVIAGINLVPALPLDGGRLYRAYRSRRIGYRRATGEAVRVGRAFAVLMVVGGIVGVYVGVTGITLPVLGLFVFSAAEKESARAAYVFTAYLSRRHDASVEARGGEARTLIARRETAVKEVLEQFVPGVYHIVCIVDADGRLGEFVSEKDVLACFFARGPETPVGRAGRGLFVDTD